MTNEEKLQYIKNKVIEVCPEVMAPTFGCEIFIANNKLSSKKGAGKIIQSFIGKETSWTGYDKAIDNISAILDRGSIRTKFSIQKNEVKIIGHPITLSHILRTIEEKYFKVGSFSGRFDGDIFQAEEDFLLKYNLENDNLNDQSKETIDFLYTLLK